MTRIIFEMFHTVDHMIMMPCLYYTLFWLGNYLYVWFLFCRYANRTINGRLHCFSCALTPGCRSVCTSAGILASYSNRPIFPESCRDSTIDDKTLYNTVIRVAGSWAPYGPIFLTIMRYYGWRRVVLISDTAIATCLYEATAVYNELKDRQHEYYVYWIRLSASPRDAELDDCLEQVRARSRSEYIHGQLTATVRSVISWHRV